MRGFRWTEEQWSAYYDALLDHDGSDPLFVGEIVIAEKRGEDMSEIENDFCKKKAASIFCVYEGRQRLTTDILMFAAIRDSILEAPVQLDDDFVQRIKDDCQNILAQPPPKRGMPFLPRIVGDSAYDGSSFLAQIQLPREKGSKGATAAPQGQDTNESEGSKSQRAAYEFFKKQVSLAEMKAGKENSAANEGLLEKLEIVYTKLKCAKLMSVTDCKNDKIAVRRIESQEHGMPQETVDWCRHHLCNQKLDTASREQIQETRAEWDELVEEYGKDGRKIVGNSCTIVAQLFLGKWMTHPSEGRSFFQKFLKQAMECQHQTNKSSYLFRELIRPVAETLHCLRSTGKAVGLEKLLSNFQGDTAPLFASIRFLRSAMKQSKVTYIKEVEIFVAAVLVPGLAAPSANASPAIAADASTTAAVPAGDSREDGDAAPSAGVSMASAQQCADGALKQLRHIEAIVFWLLFGEVRKPKRREKWDKLLTNRKSAGSLHPELTDLQLKETTRKFLEALEGLKGKDNEKKLIGVFERLNMYALHEEEKAERRTLSIIEEKVTLETIPVDANFGINVALLLKREATNKRKKGEDEFTQKQRIMEALKSSRFPLTKEMGQALVGVEGQKTMPQRHIVQDYSKKIYNALRKNWGIVVPVEQPIEPTMADPAGAAALPNRTEINPTEPPQKKQRGVAMPPIHGHKACHPNTRQENVDPQRFAQQIEFHRNQPRDRPLHPGAMYGHPHYAPRRMHPQGAHMYTMQGQHRSREELGVRDPVSERRNAGSSTEHHCPHRKLNRPKMGLPLRPPDQKNREEARVHNTTEESPGNERHVQVMMHPGAPFLHSHQMQASAWDEEDGETNNTIV